MSRQGVRRVLATYFAVAALYGIFHFLATPGGGEWDWPAIVRNVLGWTLGLLIAAGFVPALFWGFTNFHAKTARRPLFWGGLLALLLAFAAAADGFYQGALSLQKIPENAAALFSSEHDKFVRIVRNACQGNLESHPEAGATPQQSAAFCSCYANALAEGLSTRELGLALTSQNAMSRELRRRVLAAAPRCRKQVFGHG